MPITPVTPSTLSLTDVAPPMSAIDGRLLSYGAPMGDYLFVLREDLTPRALSRIAADATIRIRPNARRERSPARPWHTCAATLRLRQNAGPRRSPARSLKNWRVKRRLKPLPNFASDRPCALAHMCSALIHATDPPADMRARAERAFWRRRKVVTATTRR